MIGMVLMLVLGLAMLAVAFDLLVIQPATTTRMRVRAVLTTMSASLMVTTALQHLMG